ncbi:MAG: malto-oligosyltrehalose trehalohydrolase [Gammaproteobacteria bacterium]
MKRVHCMPFGAQVLEDGRVRFRVWAPGARKVQLCLEGLAPEARLGMAPESEGWFGIVTEMAAHETCYEYRIDDALNVPDPASRCQLEDVHGPSQVLDPKAFDWEDDGWKGRPWEETVLYELHVGTFTPEGSFASVKDRLSYLRDLGITAIELMPIGDFPGRRNWGYDGVLPYAPDRAYGHPDDLKDLIQTAHRHGLMVFIDVVYNHFGPEGNHLHRYAPEFFTDRHHTPWGTAINFDGRASRTVREFFIDNALYWLSEYHLDGLRLDAVHAIADDSRPDILEELAETVRAGPGHDRYVHLVLENDHNAARYLRRETKSYYNAQWNDDLHHALHVLLSGEHDGYYADYAKRPLWFLGRSLIQGFAYQGEPSPYRGGEPRGETSRDLPPTAFVNFLQNHDQVGNRAFGERLASLCEPRALRAAVAIMLLAPAPPLLFMGEEFAAPSPFLFFCDFGPGLAETVTEGRRKEFARFERHTDPVLQTQIPEPNALQSFERSRLDWDLLGRSPHQGWLDLYRDLLSLRQRKIVPRLAGIQSHARFDVLDERGGLQVEWRLADRARLTLLANLGQESISGLSMPEGSLLYATSRDCIVHLQRGGLGPWSVAWFLSALVKKSSRAQGDRVPPGAKGRAPGRGGSQG